MAAEAAKLFWKRHCARYWNIFVRKPARFTGLMPQKQLLHLAAQVGLPPQMLEIVKTIPVGKGIAGQVIAQGRPVTMCNLQTDTSGVARPGARQSGIGGALCVPLRHGETIVGAIGIGTTRPCEYSSEETRLLEDIGQIIGTHLSKSQPATSS